MFKGCSKFASFYLDLELFSKIIKYLISTHSKKQGLSIAQDLKKIPNPEHPLVDSGK